MNARTFKGSERPIQDLKLPFFQTLSKWTNVLEDGRALVIQLVVTILMLRFKIKNTTDPHGLNLYDGLG